MKILWLLRHAKSSWKYPKLADIERPLKKRGARDARLIGDRLKARGTLPEQIVSSPANRAFSTAVIVGARIDRAEEEIVVDRDIYGADTGELIEIIQRLPEEAHRIMLVGHNPTFHWSIEALTGAAIPHLPTAGCARIDFSTLSWQSVVEDSGTLAYLDTPKQLR